MTTINNNCEQAQLSIAAYALELQRGAFGFQNTEYVGALRIAGMSQIQAETFANTYTVIDQFSDSISGFSGTIFDKGGVKYAAIRGTEGFTFSGYSDWLTNVGEVGPHGIAIRQGIALFNWMQRLYAAEGNPVVQYAFNPIAGTINTTAGAIANGLLAGQPSLSVTGHSLGGHLAMIMSRLAPGLVREVTTFNAPGFDIFGTGMTSERFFNLLRNAVIGPVTGAIGTIWNGSLMTHLDVAGDMVHGIGNTPGTHKVIFSESANQGVYDAHLKEPIADSLALYDLFARIDPSLNATDSAIGFSGVAAILGATSSQQSRSLEVALDALRVLFSPPGIVGVALTPTGDRNAFYSNLNNAYFKNRISAYTGLLSVGSLAAKDELTLEANAFGDIAYRYALKELNSFAIVGDNALYELHNQYGELDLYDANARGGTLTQSWIADRAKLLQAELLRNTQDNPDRALLPTGGTDKWGQTP